MQLPWFYWRIHPFGLIQHFKNCDSKHWYSFIIHCRPQQDFHWPYLLTKVFRFYLYKNNSCEYIECYLCYPVVGAIPGHLVSNVVAFQDVESCDQGHASMWGWGRHYLVSCTTRINRHDDRQDHTSPLRNALKWMSQRFLFPYLIGAGVYLDRRPQLVALKLCCRLKSHFQTPLLPLLEPFENISWYMWIHRLLFSVIH